MYEKQNKLHASSNLYQQHAFICVPTVLLCRMAQADHSSMHCGHHGLLVAVSAVDAFERVLTMCCPFCSLLSKAVMGLYVGRYYELLAWDFFAFATSFGSNLFLVWMEGSWRYQFSNSFQFSCFSLVGTPQPPWNFSKSWGSNASGRTVVGTGKPWGEVGTVVIFPLSRVKSSWSTPHFPAGRVAHVGFKGHVRTCTGLLFIIGLHAQWLLPDGQSPRVSQAILWHHWRCLLNSRKPWDPLDMQLIIMSA